MTHGLACAWFAGGWVALLYPIGQAGGVVGAQVGREAVGRVHVKIGAQLMRRDPPSGCLSYRSDLLCGDAPDAGEPLMHHSLADTDGITKLGLRYARFVKVLL